MKHAPNENILRLVLTIFSVLFGILSISLIVLGVVYIDELWWPKRYVGLAFIELPTLLIILGSLSLTMSIVGCMCARTYNRTYLISFAVILFIILCLELSVSVIAFINFDEHEDGTKTSHLMKKHYYSNDKDTRLYFQRLEDHYNCCGVTGTEEECNSSSTIRVESVIVGCAKAVDLDIQLFAAEMGYFTAVLAVLQIFQIGYVILILRSLQHHKSP